MLLGQTGLTPQIIHSIPRVLHHSAVTRHFELLLFLPRPENVQDVSHRSLNTRKSQVGTSQPTFGKSIFSPQRLTTTIPKL